MGGASFYETRAFGVKAGTRTLDAGRMCPGIIFPPSQQRIFVSLAAANKPFAQIGVVCADFVLDVEERGQLAAPDCGGRQRLASILTRAAAPGR